ncbi:MAG TPA: HI0074 family nucleotidyltransferase substrate-binding subunit [Candidatus Paceibacterota bacterium]
MNDIKPSEAELDEQLGQFKQAVGKLKDGLKEQETELERDGCIQRFEFCVDLMWKTLKSYLAVRHAVICNSPRTCVREALSADVIPEDNPLWLKMLEMRNLTAHTYKEDVAREIFGQLPAAVALLESLLVRLALEE